MDYENFKITLTDKVREGFSHIEGMEIDCMAIQKVNCVRDSISIRFPSSSIAQNIYLDDLYEVHLAGASVKTLAKDTVAQIARRQSSLPDIPDITKDLACQNLYCVVVNADKNAAVLADCPHEKMEDLAVIARISVGNGGSAILTNSLCSYLQMTPEEAMEVAHRNTEKQHFTCRHINDVMRDMMIADDVPMEYVEDMLPPESESMPLYVVTNRSNIDGAAAILSSSTMDSIRDQLGGDFYILPSSRHEVMIVPVDEDIPVERLKDMVQQVNQEVVDAKDLLSDNVYRYDGRTGKITLADDPVKSSELKNNLTPSKGKAR